MFDLQIVNILTRSMNDWNQAGLLLEDTKMFFISFANWSAIHIREKPIMQLTILLEMLS